MARKKSNDKQAQISFKCSDELFSALRDLAHLSRQGVTDLLVAVCTELVKANKPRIVKFRQQAGQPIKMPTFGTGKKKAVVQQVALSDEGGASNAEN